MVWFCGDIIDSIRVEFSKQHKKKELDELGEWKKLKKNSNILFKLKKVIISKYAKIALKV